MQFAVFLFACSCLTSTVVICLNDNDCADGNYCNGAETCVNYKCAAGHNPCVNTPAWGKCDDASDGSPFTWDAQIELVNTCNETEDKCELAVAPEITHSCDKLQCNAQCDANNPCLDANCGTTHCENGDLYIYENVKHSCTADCACTTEQCAPPQIIAGDPACNTCTGDGDCARLTRTYCEADGKTLANDTGYCDLATNTCQKRAAPVNCDDGLFCNGVEVCGNGQCSNPADVDCSPFDISLVDSCSSDPLYPWSHDFRIAFKSGCSEDAAGYICSHGDETIAHVCDTGCGAACETAADCDDLNSNTVDTCELSNCECKHANIPRCGDGIKNGSEACDGEANCNMDCTLKSGGGGSTPVDGKWSDWSACSASCGGGTQVRVCTAPVNGGLECDQIDGGNATRACNAQACGGSSGGSGGGIAGDFNRNYFNNPAGGQVAGAAIDLDAIQDEIDRIRDQVNDIAGQIAGLPKGILGAATAVNTGVLPVIAAGEDISIAFFPNKIEFTVPETASAAPSKSKQ